MTQNRTMQVGLSGDGQPGLYTKRLKQDSFIAVTAKVVSTFLSFLIIPFMLETLGSERYGLWTVMGSTLAITSFFDMGLTPTLKNKLAQAFALNDKEGFITYSAASLTVGAVLCFLGMSFSVCSLAVNWGGLFGILEIAILEEANALAPVLIFLLLASLGAGMIDTIYIARLQIGRIKLFSLAATIAGFALMFVGLYWNVSLAILAFMFYVPSLITRAMLLHQLWKEGLFANRVGLRRQTAIIKEIVPSSLRFMGIQGSGVVISSAPQFMIGRFIGLTDAAVFSVAYKLITLPLSLLAEILPVFWPAFTMAWTKKDKQWLKSRLGLALAATVSLFLVAAVFFGSVGEWITAIWTNNNIMVSNNLFLLFGAWLVVQGLVYWLSTFLHSLDDFGFELVCYASTAVLQIMATMMMIEMLGLAGVIIAMAGALFFCSLVPMGSRVSRKLTTLGSG